MMLRKSLIYVSFLLDYSVTQAVELKNVQILQEGSSFELKKVTVIDDKKKERISNLYFIDSPEGALEASRVDGLPVKELEDLILDFGGDNTCVKKIKKAIAREDRVPTKFNEHCKKQFNKPKDDDFDVIIIDKDIAMITKENDMKQLMEEKGFKYTPESDGLVDLNGVSVRGYGGWKDRSKTWSKSLNENIGTKKKIPPDGSSYIELKIEGSLSGNASARLDYAYKTKFWVPYKIKMKTVTAKATFSLSGDIQINGKAEINYPGYTWSIASPRIAWGVFFVGILPVVYKVELPIRAGSGEIKIEASGNVGLKKKLSISGEYEYVCTKSTCSKVKSKFDENGGLTADNIGFQAIATVGIEPFVDVAIKADIYWGLIWAKVGLRPSFPVSINAYYGNLCGDGDGLNGNEIVYAAYLNIEFRAGVFFEMRWVAEKYLQIYRTNLGVYDLLNPSTAFSPEIRPTLNNLRDTVTLLINLRECVSDVETNYQDFSIDWDDGSSHSIADLTGTKTFTHVYPSTGTYTIKVQHQNGAYTERAITIIKTQPPVITNVQASCLFVVNNSQLKPMTKYLTRLTGMVVATGSPSTYDIFNNTDLALTKIYTGQLNEFSNEHQGHVDKFVKTVPGYIEQYNLNVTACNKIACSSSLLNINCKFPATPTILGVKTSCIVKNKEKEGFIEKEQYTTYITGSVNATGLPSTFEVSKGKKVIYKDELGVFSKRMKQKKKKKGYILNIRACNSEGCSNYFSIYVVCLMGKK